MSKKKQNPEQSQIERKHLKMVNAEPVKELYPEIIKISVSYDTSLDDAGGWERKPGGSHTYNPNSKFLFDYDCPNINCSGTFDLENEVRGLIRDHASAYKGQKFCQYNVRGHPCWVQFDYKINIGYK